MAIVKKNAITEAAKHLYDETEVFDDDEILVSNRVSFQKCLITFLTGT